MKLNRRTKLLLLDLVELIYIALAFAALIAFAYLTDVN